jgi:hypothetical protein
MCLDEPRPSPSFLRILRNETLKVFKIWNLWRSGRFVWFLKEVGTQIVRNFAVLKIGLLLRVDDHWFGQESQFDSHDPWAKICWFSWNQSFLGDWELWSSIVGYVTVSQSDLSSKAIVLERPSFSLPSNLQSIIELCLFLRYLQQELAHSFMQIPKKTRKPNPSCWFCFVCMHHWFGHHGVQYVFVLLARYIWSRLQQIAIGTRFHSIFLKP